MRVGDGGDGSDLPPPLVLVCCCDSDPLGSFFSGLGAGFPLVLLLGRAKAVAISVIFNLLCYFQLGLPLCTGAPHMDGTAQERLLLAGMVSR